LSDFGGSWAIFLQKHLVTLAGILADPIKWEKMFHSLFFRSHSGQIFNTANYIEAGLPDFSWCTIPKPDKMYQMNTKCTKL
jgi:hypothetical protein